MRDVSSNWQTCGPSDRADKVLHKVQSACIPSFCAVGPPILLNLFRFVKCRDWDLLRAREVQCGSSRGSPTASH